MALLHRQRHVPAAPGHDAAVHQPEVEPALAGGVILRRLAIVARRLRQEVELKQGAGGDHAGRHSGGVEHLPQPRAEAAGALVEGAVRGLRHDAQRRQAGCHDDRIAVVGARLGNRRRPLGGVVQRHDVGPAAKRSAGGAAGHHLRQTGQIGPHPEPALGAARSGAEAHHLVEDQHDAQLAGEAAQGLQEAGRRQGEPGRGGQRIDDHRGQPLGVLAQQRGARGGVVERKYQYLLGGAGRESGGRRDWPRPGRRPEGGTRRRQVADQRRVVDAVVGAFELGDHGPPGKGAGGAQGAQHRFGAGAAEPQPLQRGDALGEQLRQLHLQGTGREVGGAAPGLLGDGRHYRGVGVAQDQGAGVVDEVQAAVAVHVDQLHPRGVVDVERKRIHEHAGSGVAPGQHRLRAPEQCAGRRVAGAVLGNERVDGHSGSGGCNGHGHLPFGLVSSAEHGMPRPR